MEWLILVQSLQDCQCHGANLADLQHRDQKRDKDSLTIDHASGEGWTRWRNKVFDNALSNSHNPEGSFEG